MTRSALPIGVFDSGVGGLTVLHECLISLPAEDFLYLGDSGHFPYGTKSAAQLRERSGAIATELRTVGATYYGGVCVNLLRHPGWGRAQETYGEDSFHVGAMGTAFVQGAQEHALCVVVPPTPSPSSGRGKPSWSVAGAPAAIDACGSAP